MLSARFSKWKFSVQICPVAHFDFVSFFQSCFVFFIFYSFFVKIVVLSMHFRLQKLLRSFKISYELCPLESLSKRWVTFYTFVLICFPRGCQLSERDLFFDDIFISFETIALISAVFRDVLSSARGKFSTLVFSLT